MRKAAFRKKVRGRQTSSPYSLPAPTGGWNARDSIADMDEKDAIKMVNWFPDTTDVRVRKGSVDHVTGITGQVESLMPYNRSNGTQTLFAAANNEFYNVTSAGAVGAAVVTGLSNDRWQSDNYTNSSGTSYLCCFNGEDSPEYWDGSSWTTVTGASSPAITGLTTSTIISSTVHKRRLWLVQKDSLKVWYLPIDSVGGLAKSFDLSGICSRGGFVMAMGTWTLDSGEGIDDLLVAVTSEGQVVVAKGTDPSSASSWGMVGVWNVGEPLGRRCLIKYKGDLLYASVDGVYALSTALIGSRADSEQALTYKINKAVSDVTVNERGNFGWQIFHYPLGNQLMLNVPVSEGASQEQYVMNTITGSWARFKGLGANCWAILNDEAYFGGNTAVLKFGALLLNDNSANIETDLQQAYSYFGERGRTKQFISMRPNLLVNAAVSVLMDVTTDFADDIPISGISISPVTSGVWDTAVWDTGLWAGDVFLRNPWLTVHGVGTSGSVRLITAAQADIRLEATDHVFEYGGVIS